ncbi:DUF427 domain-containing protein [Alphaproteobacteria bacterium HT1-32]|nr:DUF427 domain-containing protein [Alphaproteobacteria bacterium HT1-32]
MSRRITITPAKTTFEVRYNGAVIASSDRVQMLVEAGHDPVPYFPLDSVDHSRLAATDHRTSCPYKGEASYWSVTVDGKSSENAVWSYADPLEEVMEIAGHMAFYANRMEKIGPVE